MQVIAFALMLLSIVVMLAGAVMAVIALTYTWLSILLINQGAAAAIAALMLLIGLIVFLLVKE